MRKPTFDIWGGIVNEAEALEVSGHPMEVHVNSQLRSYITDKRIRITAEGDSTFHISRMQDDSEVVEDDPPRLQVQFDEADLAAKSGRAGSVSDFAPRRESQPEVDG
jgi:hypothetical protein